jgi:hypothetical protein
MEISRVSVIFGRFVDDQDLSSQSATGFYVDITGGKGRNV